MKIIAKYFFLICLPVLFMTCRSLNGTKTVLLSANTKPLDYSKPTNWIVGEKAENSAINLNLKGYPAHQESAKVDVFYIHPTTLMSFEVGNGIIENAEYRKEEDEVTQKQATAFASSARVWAPRYRQASVISYTSNSDKAKNAFNVAYNDVLASFDYYLKHFNHGRPIILAGHSQGATWVVRLLKERFEKKPLKKQLVVADVIGEFIVSDTFESIRACNNKTETNCVCSWVTC